MSKNRILAHRGFWLAEEEKNSWEAIKKALTMGFGIETDIRDYQGKLVISHDIADKNSILFEQVLKFYTKEQLTGTLAINIKSDGILILIKEMMERYGIQNYFVFDMSIPETVIASRIGINYLTRKSDIEDEILYDDSQGIWLDAFFRNDWIDEKTIQKYLKKTVCLVSPELHRMKNDAIWCIIKESGIFKNKNFLVCTDFPQQFWEWCYEKN